MGVVMGVVMDVMLDLVTGVHAVAAVLLIVSGILKLRDPAPTVEFLGSVGLLGSSGPDIGDGPRQTAAARIIGGFEIAVGLAGLVVGGNFPALVVAALYLMFAGLVGRAMTLGLPSCACFGSADTPPSSAHIVVDLVLAAVSVAAVGADAPVDVMDSQPLGGLLFVVVVGVVAGVLLTLLKVSPGTSGRSRSQRA